MRESATRKLRVFGFLDQGAVVFPDTGWRQFLDAVNIWRMALD